MLASYTGLIGVSHYTNCIRGLGYNRTAGILQQKHVGSKRRKQLRHIGSDHPKTAVRALNLA